MKNNTDRSFDGIAEKFQRNIYLSSKGKIRLQVLLRDLAELPLLQQPCQILDVGAGQGQLSLALASHGHHVLLTDISADMLQMARQHAQQQGIANVDFAHISLNELALQQAQNKDIQNDDIRSKQVHQYPLVLCHAMLEWLADPQAAITQLKSLVAPGGVLSLMFYNIDAKRFGNILFGNLDYVAANLQVKKKVSLSPQHPLSPAEVASWCAEAGFKLLAKTGVRCFHDYLQDKTMQQSHFEQLLALELQYNRTEPYASLGRYQHLLLQRPL